MEETFPHILKFFSLSEQEVAEEKFTFFFFFNHDKKSILAGSRMNMLSSGHENRVCRGFYVFTGTALSYQSTNFS